jgi:hypothetical protein
VIYLFADSFVDSAPILLCKCCFSPVAVIPKYPPFYLPEVLAVDCLKLFDDNLPLPPVVLEAIGDRLSEVIWGFRSPVKSIR